MHDIPIRSKCVPAAKRSPTFNPYLFPEKVCAFIRMVSKKRGIKKDNLKIIKAGNLIYSIISIIYYIMQRKNTNSCFPLLFYFFSWMIFSRCTLKNLFRSFSPVLLIKVDLLTSVLNPSYNFLPKRTSFVII